VRVSVSRPLRLVLIRHGEKKYVPAPENQWPLDSSAHAAVAALSFRLGERQLRPDLILSSRWRHAVDTAKILASLADVPMIEVTGLTPKTDERCFTPRAIFREVRTTGIPIGDVRTVAAVGHHARVSNLAGLLCGGPPLRELARLEGAVLFAESLHALLRRRAVFEGFLAPSP